MSVAVCLLASLTWLGACTVAVDGDQQAGSSGFMEFAADPVENIRFSSLIQWKTLARDWLLLRFNQNRYFIVKVAEPCLGDVREAGDLRLVPAISNRLNRFDRVVLDGRVCRIDEMRPFDHQAWQTASPDHSAATTG